MIEEKLRLKVPESERLTEGKVQRITMSGLKVNERWLNISKFNLVPDLDMSRIGVNDLVKVLVDEDGFIVKFRLITKDEF